MDPAAHLANKLLADRARQPTVRRPQAEPQHESPQPETAGPPPPYNHLDSAPDSDLDLEMDSDDSDSEDESEDSAPSALRLTINATHTIRGSNNIVPTSATPLSDASKFSALLLHAVNNINNAATSGSGRKRRGLHVDLTINCGINIVGNRNVVGNVGVKQKTAVLSAGGLAQGLTKADGRDGSGEVVVGAKRKAEEEVEDAPERKMPAI